MRHLANEAGLSDRLRIDSAGTSGWHVGDGADRRTAAAARARGIEMEHGARQFTATDFVRFDHILAMDHDNVAELHALAPDADARAKIVLLRAFDPASPADAVVPDPYYGGPSGFSDVIDLCEAACRGLLDAIAR